MNTNLKEQFEAIYFEKFGGWNAHKESILDLMQAAYTLGQQSRQQEWVPCSERLPDKNVDVWVWDGTNSYRAHLMRESEKIFAKHKGKVVFDDAELFSPITTATHWMPYLRPQKPQI